jgi:nitroreductase
MQLEEAIHGRRAVRAYTTQRVKEGLVHKVLRAATQAPSAMNEQPWTFSIIQDSVQLKRYSDGAKSLLLDQRASDPKIAFYEELLRNASFNIFYDASTLIVIGVEKRGAFSEADCWLAAENLMLSAYAEGLGSCCIGFAVQVLNTPDALAELRIPGGAAIAAIILGYPIALPSEVSRAEPKIVSWTR